MAARSNPPFSQHYDALFSAADRPRLATVLEVSASTTSRLINHEVHAPTAYTWSNGRPDATRMPSQARKVTAVKINAYERIIHGRCAATWCWRIETNPTVEVSSSATARAPKPRWASGPPWDRGASSRPHTPAASTATR